MIVSADRYHYEDIRPFLYEHKKMNSEHSLKRKERFNVKKLLKIIAPVLVLVVSIGVVQALSAA